MAYVRNLPLWDKTALDGTVRSGRCHTHPRCARATFPFTITVKWVPQLPYIVGCSAGPFSPQQMLRECGWAWMAYLALQQVRALSELTSRLLRLLQLLPQQCQFLLQDKHPCVSCLGQAFGSTPVRRSFRGQGFRDRQQLSELFKEGLHRCPCSQRLLSV